MENAELDGLSDWIYDKITETSKMAQKVYAIYLSGVAYGLLTIFTITDLQLVVNERIRLPIINMDLPVTVFFVLTPIMLLVSYFYFQIYHFNAVDLIRKGKKNDLLNFEYKYYSWFINKNNFPAYGFNGFIERAIFKIIMWWSLPFVLLMCSMVFIKKHDIVLGVFTGMMPVVGVCIVLYFWFRYDDGCGLKKVYGFYKDGDLSVKDLYVVVVRNYGKIILCLISLVYFNLFFFAIIPGISGGKGVDSMIQKIATIHLENVVINDGAHRYGLDNINLSGADLINVTIKNSSIRNAILENARIVNCDFEGSDFTGSKFKNVYMYHNIFRNVDFSKVIFDSVQLSYLELTPDGVSGYSGAKLDSFSNNLLGVKIISASIKNSIFSNVDMSYSNISGSSINNTSFDHCNISHSLFSDNKHTNEKLIIENSEFKSCLMDSIKIMRSTDGVLLKNDKFIFDDLSGSEFYMIKMEHITFLGNMFTGASFLFSDFEGVTFWDSANQFFVYNYKGAKPMNGRVVMYTTGDQGAIIYNPKISVDNSIKENMGQLADLKYVTMGNMDNFLYSKIKQHYPSILIDNRAKR